MRTLALLLMLALGLALAGCGDSHSAEVKAFVDERLELVGQMAGKVDANPNGTGVDEARKIFEAKQAGLSAKRDTFKNAKISFDLYQQLIHADVTDRKFLESIRLKRFAELDRDPAVLSKYERLCSDYMNAVSR